MSTPVITNKWAGNFDCPGPCIRKRLAGGDFSKKAMERYHKTGLLSNCKNCTAAIAVKERLVGEREKGNNNNNDNNSEEAEKRKCTNCEKTLPKSLYNRSQWKKGEGLARCRPCVESVIINEADTTQTTLKNKMALVRAKIVEAEKRGNVLARVQAESELSALEAEHVTGLKPVRMGGRMGGGRGKGRGRGTGKSRVGGGGRGGSGSGGRGS